jgi:hypothetical protein
MMTHHIKFITDSFDQDNTFSFAFQGRRGVSAFQLGTQQITAMKVASLCSAALA